MIMKAMMGIFLLGIAITQIDFHKTWDNLQQCDYRFLLLAALVSFGNVFWAMWIRKKLLNLLEKASYGIMLKAFFVTNYIRHFVPANLGGLLGEPWGLYSFSQGRISVEKGLAFVILTTITQNIRRILITLLGLLLLFPLLPGGYVGIISLAVIAYAVYTGMILLLTFPRLKVFRVLKPFQALNSRIANGFSDKFKFLSKTIGEHFRWLLHEKRTYLILGILTMSNIVLESLRLWLLLYSFGVSFNFFSLLLIPSLAYSVTVLPISLGGIGISELSGIIIFQSFGIAAEISFAVVFLDRFLFTYWGFMLGGLFIPFLKNPFRK